jgi:hypothetical protein
MNNAIMASSFFICVLVGRLRIFKIKRKRGKKKLIINNEQLIGKILEKTIFICLFKNLEGYIP